MQNLNHGEYIIIKSDILDASWILPECGLSDCYYYKELNWFNECKNKLSTIDVKKFIINW